MTMDMNVQQRGSNSLLGTNVSNNSASTTSSSNNSTTPPSTPSYSPSLPTTATTGPQSQPQPRTVKRSFDVAFLMAPDENLAKRQQLRLVAANSLLKRSSSPEQHSPYGDSHLETTRTSGLLETSTDLSPRSRLASHQNSKATLFEQSVSGLLLPRSQYTQEELVDRVPKTSNNNENKSPEMHLINMSLRTNYQDEIIDRANKNPPKVHELDSISNSAMIRSAFTKVTTSAKFDPSALLNMPVPTSPSSVSSLSGGGLSPDHMTYQGSMSPPVIAEGPTSSPISPHFMPTANKPFPCSMPLLSPQSHVSGTSTSGKSLPSSYSSTAFLLQQEHSAKHIKASNGLCNNGSLHNSSNVTGNNSSSFRSDIDNYLMKASMTGGNHQLYGGTNDKDLLVGFPGTSNSGTATSAAAKLRPASGMLYPHPESVAAYSTLAAAAAYPFAANFSTELLVSRAPPATGILAATNPAAAAAMVSASLLPPSFAALSLPAQNVCAKCNISFRMTSDLVYHMRSQHKGDSQAGSDPLRRRREQDKLKCPVCNESFRERHHLTRHMTAHQDKEGDMDDQDEPSARRRIGVVATGAGIAGGK